MSARPASSTGSAPDSRQPPDPDSFIAGQTTIEVAPGVPELRLHLATEITPIWQATETHLDALNIEPPFWAFSWPGSQLLARYALDHPGRIAGRSVLDFACGGGLAAIACARAGAKEVFVNDIDPLALHCAGLNATLNDVRVTPLPGDLSGTDIGDLPPIDLLLCGDVCYNQSMADRLIPWLRRCAASMEVWMADPGRPYAPKTGIEILRRSRIATTLELEGKMERDTTLYRILPG